MRADEVEIPKPCSIDLREPVSRGTKQFHCEHCDRSVHVLSHLSEEEAAELLARRERDNLCVAYLRTPDGQIRFRPAASQQAHPAQPTQPTQPIPALVPAARLHRPREALRASALALTVAACSPDTSGDLLGFTSNVEQVDHVVGGAPPQWDEEETNKPATDKDAVPCPPTDEAPTDEPPTDVDYVVGGAPPRWEEDLTDEPPADKPATKAGARPEPVLERSGRWRVHFADLDRDYIPLPQQAEATAITVEYCVGARGRILDAKLVDGDEQVFAQVRQAMRDWEFRPFEVDGHPVEVCTVETIDLPRFDARRRL